MAAARQFNVGTKTYSIMRLNEGVVDCYDFDVAMLHAVVNSSASSHPGVEIGKIRAGYIRIAKDDSANTTKTVDTNECLRHYWSMWWLSTENYMGQEELQVARKW